MIQNLRFNHSAGEPSPIELSRLSALRERDSEIANPTRLDFHIIQFVIEGMNKGLTPDELVDYVKLPRIYADKDYLREYYGNVEWAVRSIFSGTLGWFDGNPTSLFSLPVKDEAEQMAALAGGEDKLEQAAVQALAKQNYQWAAQLCDHLIAIDPEATKSQGEQ